MKVLIAPNFNHAMAQLPPEAQREVAQIYQFASTVPKDELVNSPILTKLAVGDELYTLRTRGTRIFCSFPEEDVVLFVDVSTAHVPSRLKLDKSEITLFSTMGVPKAYIAHEDDNTIYSFDGRPLAYIDQQTNVWGFNGRHLGWFDDDILWDHGGRRVGFTAETCPTYRQFEPFKGFRQFKPFKAFRQFAPMKPLKSYSNSEIELLAFLVQGRV